jgi:hypothetical protein
MQVSIAADNNLMIDGFVTRFDVVEKEHGFAIRVGTFEGAIIFGTKEALCAAAAAKLDELYHTKGELEAIGRCMIPID